MTNETKEDKILIFKLRCRVTDTKTNKKGLYDDYECDIFMKMKMNPKNTY